MAIDPIEEVRNFWDARPCNVRHSREPLGTRAYFDEVERRRYFVEPHIPDFAGFARWQGKRVLEIGCGIGTDSVNFARAGADLTVVDLSARSLEIARQRFEVYGLSARFYRGSAERLSDFLPPETYDLIYSFGVIHHTPSPQKVLQELLAFCGPQTELRVMLYSRWSWKVLWIAARHGRGRLWRLDELIRRHSEAQTGCPVTFTYTYRGACQLMRDYRIANIRKAHIFPYRIDKYRQHEYEKEWYFRLMPSRLFHWLERRLGWHTLITAYLASGCPT